MDRSEFHVNHRDVLGKAVRRLRRQGIVPANLYGHNIASVPLQLDVRAFTNFLKNAGTTRLINIRIAGESRPRPVLIRDIKRLPGVGGIAHIDFYQVAMSEKVKVRVPVVTVGEAPAIKDTDGILVHNLDAVEVEALPGDLPGDIQVDVSELREIGDHILLGDLMVPSGVMILGPLEDPVITIEAPTPEVEEIPAEVPSEPVEESEAGEETEAA